MSGLESLIQNIEFQANTKVLDVIVAKIKSVKKATDSLKASGPKVQAMLDKNSGMGMFAEMSAKNSATARAGADIASRLRDEQAAIKKLGIEAKAAADKMKGFRMEFLGIMFAGQALQRFFGGLFKDMLKFFKGIAGSTNPLNKSLTALEANFSFLKYSIIEAMSGPIMAFTDLMISFISFLTDQDPAVLEAIGLAITAIAVAGGLMFVGGQAALAANSIGMFLENINNGTYGKSLMKFAEKDLPKFKTAMIEALGSALIIWGGIRLLENLADSSGKPTTLAQAIQTSAMLGAGIQMVLGKGGLLTFFIVMAIQVAEQPDLFGNFLLQAADLFFKLSVMMGAWGVWATNLLTRVFSGGLWGSKDSFSETLKKMISNSSEDKAAMDKYITDTFITPWQKVGEDDKFGSLNGLRAAYTGAINDPMAATPAIVSAANTSLTNLGNDTIKGNLVPNFTNLNLEAVDMSANFQYATKTAMPQLVSQSIVTCSQIDRQTESTLAAARAQERWNKALANKPKPGSSSSSTSFSSAFGNTGSVGA